MKTVKDNQILVTGGSGMLGTALKNVMPDALYPTHQEFDVTKNWTALTDYLAKRSILTVFHGAAFTSPPKIDKNPIQAINSNILGTTHITLACMYFNIKLIYMSTDYVFDGTKGKYREDNPVYPVNKYAWSKLGGECAVRMYDNSLIIRTNMCPEPFPYEKAFIDQITTRDYISNVTLKIVKLIKSNLTGTIHIGGKRQRIYTFARETRPDVEELLREDVPFEVPYDVSLNCGRWESWIKKLES